MLIFCDVGHTSDSQCQLRCGSLTRGLVGMFTNLLGTLSYEGNHATSRFGVFTMAQLRIRYALTPAHAPRIKSPVAPFRVKHENPPTKTNTNPGQCLMSREINFLHSWRSLAKKCIDVLGETHMDTDRTTHHTRHTYHHNDPGTGAARLWQWPA